MGRERMEDVDVAGGAEVAAWMQVAEPGLQTLNVMRCIRGDAEFFCRIARNGML